jgi:hypothetical protein
MKSPGYDWCEFSQFKIKNFKYTVKLKTLSLLYIITYTFTT